MNIKKMFLVIVLILFTQSQALSEVPSLQDGDALFKKSEFSKALSVYEKHFKLDPTNYEVLWRLARCYSKWGWSFPKSKIKLKKKYLAKAVDYARKAIEVSDNGFEGHLYLAESLGKLAKYKGAEKKVRFVREIKKEAKRAIDLNPSHFKPYMILGIWHRKVAEAGWLEKQLAQAFFGKLPEASLDEAEKNIKKSIALKEDFLESHYALALVYKSMKKKKLLVEELEKTVKCPVLDSEDKRLKKKAMVLLKRYK